MRDWIDLYMTETSGVRSPPEFRLWAAITAIAGALERRAWTHTMNGALYPNMYTILTGLPASGKGLAVNTTRNLWVRVPKLSVGPDNPTKASFLDSLESSAKVSVNGGGATLFSALSVGCREIGVLLRSAGIEFLEDLTDIWDNPPLYDAPRRDKSRSVKIEKPTVNILAASTPSVLGDLIPDSAWNQGFTSRLIFIYGVRPETSTVNLFSRRSEINTPELAARLIEMHADIHGEFEWTPEAQEVMNSWFNAGMSPAPDYSRLTHYLGRRDSHVIKLAMISAVSMGRGTSVSGSDVRRAKEWLLNAEELMPDVFRAMTQRSDDQVINDLHYHMVRLYSVAERSKRVPLDESVIWDFLKSRVTSERIPRIIDAALRSGMISKGIHTGTWIPRPIDMTK